MYICKAQSLCCLSETITTLLIGYELLCLTLPDPMDHSPLSSSVLGILQVKTLEWVIIPFSQDLLNLGIELGSPALQTDSLPSEPPGKPILTGYTPI